jgi:hypothetical protein
MFATIEEYMHERYQILLRRRSGDSYPWTKDTILQQYKFTNVLRNDDKTTRRFVEHLYLPNADRPLWNILGNAAIFRYFGRFEFAEELGWQDNFKSESIVKLARDRSARGESNYTGAYMVTNAGRVGPKEEVLCTFIKGVWDNAKAIADECEHTRTWESMVLGLRKLDGFGGSGFMAKEVALDTFVIDQWVPEDKMTWTPLGPGGRRGLNRVCGRPLNKNIAEQTMLQEISMLREHIMKNWPKKWPELSVTDIQFNLCEWDKYCRVRDGEGRPRSKYKPN